MAFGIGDDGIVAVPMSEAKMPVSNMNPMPQELPGGSQPVTGPAGSDDVKPETIAADDDAKEEKSKEIASGEGEPETVQPPAVIPPAAPAEPSPPPPPPVIPADPQPETKPEPEADKPELLAPGPAKREPEVAALPLELSPAELTKVSRADASAGDVYDTRAARPHEG